MENFIITPGKITHTQKPVFYGNWFAGKIESPQDCGDYFYHQGGGENDNILIYGIKWEDIKPNQKEFNTLMDNAITAIDSWIAARF